MTVKGDALQERVEEKYLLLFLQVSSSRSTNLEISKVFKLDCWYDWSALGLNKFVAFFRSHHLRWKRRLSPRVTSRTLLIFSATPYLSLTALGVPWVSLQFAQTSANIRLALNKRHRVSDSPSSNGKWHDAALVWLTRGSTTLFVYVAESPHSLLRN